MNVLEIQLNEVIQANSTYLAKFNCPYCGKAQLQGMPIKNCQSCDSFFPAKCLVLPATRSGYRLLTGTKRKQRVAKKTIRKLIEVFGQSCVYCYKDLSDQQYHIDHIVPLAFGGTNSITNLVISCPKCNLIASDKVFDTINDKRLYILSKKRIS